MPEPLVEHDATYARAGERDLHIRLALPDGQSELLPVIVYIHGGGWLGGDYTTVRSAQFIPHGFAAASIQYRFSTEAAFPAQIHDCKAAIRYIRAHAGEFGIHPDRIGVWGESAGGHLAALLGTSGGVEELEGNLGSPGQSSRVQAVCAYSGPTKFVPDAGEPEPVTQIPEVLVQLMGGTRDEKPELYRLGSPFEHISPAAPPFLLVHGDSDELVPVGQSEIFAKALRRAGAEATLIKVKKGTHGFHDPDQTPSNEEILGEVLAFFSRHLKG